MTIEYLHNPNPPRFTSDHWAEYHVYQGRLNQEMGTAERAMIRVAWKHYCIRQKMPHMHLDGAVSAIAKAKARGLVVPDDIPTKRSIWEPRRSAADPESTLAKARVRAQRVTDAK